MQLLTVLVATTLLAVTLAAPARGQLITDPLMAQFLAQEPLASPALVKARQHFFGPENVNPKTGRVNPDKVILSWFSVSSLAAALRGHVVLLDTYIDSRENYPNRVPTTLDDVQDADGYHVLVLHGHVPAAPTPFESVRASIERKVAATQLDQHLKDVIATLARQAHIEMTEGALGDVR